MSNNNNSRYNNRNKYKKRRKNGNNRQHNHSNNNQAKEILPFIIDRLSHEGRGVAVYGNGYSETDGHHTDKQGKKIFVNFALPNEVVKVQLTNVRKNFEQGDCIQVLDNPHPHRTTPICPHYIICGGCSLQHLNPTAQIDYKQSALADLLAHQSRSDQSEQNQQLPITPQQWLDPIVGDRVGYRSKARIGVRYIAQTDSTVIGFRSRATNHLIDIEQCPILHPQFAKHFTALKSLLNSLEARKYISHLEVAVGEKVADQNLQDKDQHVAIIIRHLQPLSKADIACLQEFFTAQNWQLYLQGNDKSTLRVPTNQNFNHSQKNQLGSLYYQLPQFDLTMAFIPTDFTQVNYSVNRQMIAQACELLDLQIGETVLDLFCGLGNFSLPMARQVGGADGDQGLVIGVEGSEQMKQRATDNAIANNLYNTQFYAQDLTQPLAKSDWAKRRFDAVLIDPPRSGALEIVEQITRFDAQRIVYISCNPATLARDTQVLINNGYCLSHAGVMDMFCHTGHVESIARFERL